MLKSAVLLGFQVADLLLLFELGAHFQTFSFGGPPRRARPQPQSNGLPTWLQLIPLFFVIWILISSILGQPEPAFSFQRTSVYSVEKTTQFNSLPFYVKPDFAPTVSSSPSPRLLCFAAPKHECPDVLGLRENEDSEGGGEHVSLPIQPTMQSRAVGT